MSEDVNGEEGTGGVKGHFRGGSSVGEFFQVVALPFFCVTPCLGGGALDGEWLGQGSVEGQKGCAFVMHMSWASGRVKPDQLGGSKSNVGSSCFDQGQLAGS